MNRRPGHPRLVGAVTAVIAIGMLVLSFAPRSLFSRDVLHLHLATTAFGEVNPGSWVELNGAKVGQVDGVSYRDDTPEVDISVEGRYASLLHSDATAQVRPHGLLGPKYVEMQGGTSGQLHDGDTIGLASTHVSVDFDQVTYALQSDVRTNLQVFLQELGTGAAGRGQDMNAAFQHLGAASAHLETVTQMLQARDPDLNTLVVAGETLDRDLQHAPSDANIRDTDLVLAGLVPVESSIGGSIDHTASVLGQLQIITSGNSANLAHALGSAPGAVDHLQSALVGANALVAGIAPSVPALLNATVETGSSFGFHDANGYYGRVLMLNGPCSGGAPDPTASCSTANGQVPGATADSGSAPPARGPELSDQQLLQLLLSN
ncbi:MAG: MlaD family protein [Candidatus Dormibacteria bacterium]